MLMTMPYDIILYILQYDNRCVITRGQLRFINKLPNERYEKLYNLFTPFLI